MAVAGVHRDQPHHLRSSLAIRTAPEARAGADRRPPERGHRSRRIRQDSRVYKTLLGQPGNHNDTTAQKILPEFTFEELRAAGLAALHQAGHQGDAGFTDASFQKEIEELKPSFFDPDFEPLITAKSPRGGLDILEASANNFYSGVKLSDLKDFTERYPLNSRLVKQDGHLEEQVYRAGTPDHKVPPGRYAEYLAKANSYLEKAAEFAEPAQAKAIRDLILYYQTGDPQDWLRFDVDWVQNNASVDFANGFIEVYRDARGAKATSQSFVSVVDNTVDALMHKIAANAQYFEDHAPWPAQYRKQGVMPPLAKAVEILIETGDFHVTTIGDNLPNEDQIHEKYGSKSFIFLAARGRWRTPRAMGRSKSSLPRPRRSRSASSMTMRRKTR